jgi:hypothetical protein
MHLDSVNYLDFLCGSHASSFQGRIENLCVSCANLAKLADLFSKRVACWVQWGPSSATRAFRLLSSAMLQRFLLVHTWFGWQGVARPAGLLCRRDFYPEHVLGHLASGRLVDEPDTFWPIATVLVGSFPVVNPSCTTLRILGFRKETVIAVATFVDHYLDCCSIS